MITDLALTAVPLFSEVDTLHALTTGQGPALQEAARAQSPSLTGRTVSPSPATPTARTASAVPDQRRAR
ncbi:hypothetical protein ABT354_17060 [Streptomyces sp. NPDC000594]|uniref:hypothetical protein n=1 Tax=Streptomyces sp. NPDC000594 TaxID=3154261 RepID=UPI00331DBA74